MKYLITDRELLDYVTGKMEGEAKKELERKAVRSKQTDLLLYAQLADYAATGTSTDDIIGEDTFIPDEEIKTDAADFQHFRIAAELKKPDNEKNSGK